MPSPNLSQRQLIIVGGILGAILVISALIYFNLRSDISQERLELLVWGTEDPSAMNALGRAYGDFRKNITVRYEQIAEERYVQEVLRGLASGEGPDVVLIGNRTLPELRSALASSSPAQFTIGQFRAAFPAVAETDFIDKEGIYALPLYLDTLALIYNKEHFDQAGVAEPPATWDAFRVLLPRLRSLSGQSQIIRAAAAIGGSDKTIRYAVDILNLLMLQNGATMVDSQKISANFGRSEGGQNAFNFYLQFANAGSPYYTWNESQTEALEGFASGKVSMVFAYERDIDDLKRKNPFLKFGAAPVPQLSLEQKISYPFYQGLAVSRQSKNPQWGWDFAIFAATSDAGEGAYAAEAQRPPALRSRIAALQNDAELGAFASQALVARSWYMKNAAEIASIFGMAIQDALSGRVEAVRALEQAEDRVSQVMRR